VTDFVGLSSPGFPAETPKPQPPMLSPQNRSGAGGSATFAPQQAPQSSRSVSDVLHDAGLLSPLAHVLSAGTPQFGAPLAAARVNPLLLHLGEIGGVAVNSEECARARNDEMDTVPSLVRRGREHAGARCFLFQRPFRMRKRGDSASGSGGNEYLDLWVRRVYLVTRHAFPTTHRRSPVVRMFEVVLNPVEAAIAGLQERREALSDLIERAAAGPDRCAEQGFTQALQGVVDAAVSGGVSNYRAFVTGSFRETHPEIAADLDDERLGKSGLIDDLRSELLAQVAVVARGIRVHATKCSASMLPLHDFLFTRFASLREMMVAWGVLGSPPIVDK
jgi:hypothetical protein